MSTAEAVGGEQLPEKLKYPVSLALLDYAPVVLTLFGQWTLMTVLPNAFAPVWAWAVAGALMMFTGGFLKATWKTIIAATEKDIRWMEHALFLFLAPGAALFAWALWKAYAGGAGNESVLAPILLSAVLVAVSLPRLPRSKKWFLPLVALLTVSMGVISFVAAALARGAGHNIAAALFIASFVVSLVTAGLSRRAATIETQWVMEWANTGAALLFAVGALELGQTFS